MLHKSNMDTIKSEVTLINGCNILIKIGKNLWIEKIIFETGLGYTNSLA